MFEVSQMHRASVKTSIHLIKKNGIQKCQNTKEKKKTRINYVLTMFSYIFKLSVAFLIIYKLSFPFHFPLMLSYRQ